MTMAHWPDWLKLGCKITERKLEECWIYIPYDLAIPEVYSKEVLANQPQDNGKINWERKQ